MVKLYVINEERRKASDELANISCTETTNQKNKRINKSVLAEHIITIQESKIREQEKLWDQLNIRDSKKYEVVKISYGIFSIFLSTILALISFSDKGKFDEMVNSPGFIALFSIIVIGMALINMSIIMHIISFKHSRLLFIRQINCLRYAIDSCDYALIVGNFPCNSKELRDKNSEYYRCIGKHRKLPVTNDKFREFHRRIFESADNYTILVIVFLTVCLALLPIFYMWNSGSSNIIGAFSAIVVILFCLMVYFIHKKANLMTDTALNEGRDYDNESEKSNIEINSPN
ncbi:hypothetical protein Nit79A3_1250 [Nitrosomonas sp. Is79A3]|uniref:hypothetical protein n=1 Tax=Nitrosomonas sp. (strain Is79A3) TaxID=261292 RepID=UPI000215CC47